MELTTRFPLKPLKSDDQHQRAVAIIGELMGKKLDPGTSDYLDTLILLTNKYEDDHHTPNGLRLTPQQALKAIMDANGLSQAQIGSIIGSESAVSMFLNGERALSKSHIKGAGCTVSSGCEFVSLSGTVGIKYDRESRFGVSPMAIDKTGKWWLGSKPTDLREYLAAFSENSQPIDEFRLAICNCKSVEFRVESDDNEGTAQRTCAKCKKKHFVCDSGEYGEDAEPKKWKCVECNSTTANVGAGFALYDGKADIKWIYIGVRCSKCGVLGCAAGWKVGYSPSLQLMDKV